MKKEILDALINLFSIISVFYKKLSEEEAFHFIEVFLETEYHLENISEYTGIINESINKYNGENNEDNRQLKSLCYAIRDSLPIKMRILILVHTMQFLKYSGIVKDSLLVKSEEQEAAKIIADIFKIDKNEYVNFAAFISNMLYKVEDKENLLIISKQSIIPDKIKFIEREELNGKIIFLFIKSVNLYLFFYDGEQDLQLNNKPLYSRYLYLFSHNSVISGTNFHELFYHEILAAFSINKYKLSKVVYEAREISYKFKNSNNGIQPLSFIAKSFQFIGIMGGSGSGKTTLLNLLNGNIKPHKGEIFINGKSFFKHKKEIKKIIGYVPQEDSLIEELTVFENLYYPARFCYNNLQENDIIRKVNDLLTELDLFDIKDLKVGSVLNKLISGGQRKRLNIAIELIREPQILFVDEPTSGLSSADAEKIIYLLADQVNKGRMVMTNIHQPSSEIFKLFDKLIILDKGGYPVFIGAPVDVFDYFREKTGRIDILKGFTKHGFFIPEEIFRLLEDQKLNEYGEATGERVYSPEDWYRIFRDTSREHKQHNEESELPKPGFKPPNRSKQALIYFKRNFKAKLGDMQYMLIALLIAPLLAIILSYFTKNTQLNVDGKLSYSFSMNENMPSFFFMSVIVALFIGLIVSAEEIINDRKLILRESFLNLSLGAYFHSKILFLVLLGFVQTLLYVLLSSIILNIPDIGMKFFFIMFSLSCFANMLGLVISASMHSVIAIYITIPLILIPQLLLSGTVVNFDDLHYSISSKKYVPFAGDIMASRWGVEALMVEQFKNNEYEKLFYSLEKKISDYSYLQYHLIPIVNNALNDAKQDYNQEKSLLIVNGFKEIANTINNIKTPNYTNYSDTSKIKAGLSFLRKCKSYLTAEINKLVTEKDKITSSMIEKFNSKDAFLNFKNNHFNESIARIVKRDNIYSKQIIIDNSDLIRKIEPIFHIPENKFGRSHFYSPVKKIGNLFIDTYWFNSLVIWFMWLLFYFILLFNLPERINKILKNINFKT